MSAPVHLVAELATVLGVAAITSLLARFLKQPPILGFLLAGMVVGPHTSIPLFADEARVHESAELGVVLVMFAIGLEFRIKKLVAVLPTSGLTGLLQVFFVGWCGFTVAQILGWSLTEALFAGAGLAISSTMVVSKVLVERPVRDDVREHVFGVLVVQDVIAIGLIAAMTAIAAGGGMGARDLAWMIGRLAGVLVAIIGGGLLVVPRAVRMVLRMGSAEVTTVFAVGLCFAFALLAQALGYSVALGSFVAGMLVAESGRGAEIEHTIVPLRDVFAAIFFVSIGMTVDPLLVWQHLPISLLLAAVVIAAQLLSVTAVGMATGLGLHRSMVTGLALGQVGEFGFILGGIGISAGVVRPDLQPILVTVAVITAFTTPLAIGISDKLVGMVDRLLPERLGHLLSLYDAWFARLRRPADERERRKLRKAINAIILDGIGLIAVLALAFGFSRRAGWLVDAIAMSRNTAVIAVLGLAFLLSLPLAIGLVRNTIALARHAGEVIGVDDAGGRAGVRARAGRAMVYLVVAAGVGLPAMALLRSITGQEYGLVLFAVGVVVASVIAWRGAGALDHEFRSGAERVAKALSRAASEGEEDLEGRDTVVPGLDTVGMRVAAGTTAVGKTLAHLNLRAKTGATVVAIHRGGEGLVLPTGQERLQAGDLLAMAGTTEALDRARELIHAAE